MIQVRSTRLVFISLLLCTSAVFGLLQLKRSSLFLIQSINVVWVDANSNVAIQAVDENEVRKLLHVSLGKIGLFDYKVAEAERDLLTHEWIRAVKVKRKFPNSLEVLVSLRSPKAVIQSSKDTLRYVDQEGVIFGYPDLKSIVSLPIISGFAGHVTEIRQAILLLDHWDGAFAAKTFSISSVYFDSERGFRILVSYPFKRDEKNQFLLTDNKFRTMIDLGQEIDGSIDQKITVLSSVIKYLSEHSIPVRQIWAEVDKKVVVKTVHGS